MTDREIMRQALDALELLARCEHPLTKIQVRKPRDGGSIVTVYPHQVATDAAEPLRERLEQPEQEPVAWREFDGEGGYDYRTYDDNENFRDEYIKRNGQRYASWVEPLYTTPQRREWVGLTDDQVSAIADQHSVEGFELDIMAFARSIEAKLKEKNT